MNCPTGVPCRSPGECAFHRRQDHFRCLRDEIERNVSTYLARNTPPADFQIVIPLFAPSDESANLEAA